jgi:alpha-D-ribose 1-methylphosphonate 5-triphosphate synthase subunit PhnI
LEFPSSRSQRLQILTRGQTGAVTSLAYAVIRGYGALHPTVGELRLGSLPVYIDDPVDEMKEEEDSYYIGEIKVTEAEMLIPVTIQKGNGKEEIEFEIGYGICYGQNETKAIAMGILDNSLEKGNAEYPTQDEEFVLYHIDSVESTGFISHLKMPHYVTFQSKLDSVRKTKKDEGMTDGKEADTNAIKI